jgi:hypothetical protein
MATIAFILVVAVSLPWTASTKGAEAPAIAALKYPLTAIALLLSFRARRPATRIEPATWLLVFYWAATVVGALLGPSTGPSLLRSARFLLVVLATVWVTSRLGVGAVIRLFARLAMIYSAVAFGTLLVGLNPLEFGRLRGFLPPAHPNNLGALAGIGLVVVLGVWATGRRLEPGEIVAIPILLGTLVLSGSRGSLLATGCGLVVAFSLPSARNRGTSLIYALLVVVTLNALGGNPLSTVWSRDSEKGVSLFDASLTGRTKAWDSVIKAPATAGQFVAGRGLNEKVVPVRDKYAPEQAVHGAWLSAYFQAGLLGALALAVALALAGRGIGSESSATAVFLVGTYVFIVVHSFFESTLNDVSILLPVLVAFAAAPRRRNDADQWQPGQEGGGTSAVVD